MADGVASNVVGKVVDSVFGVITTEIGYMWNCTQIVETFKNEVAMLKVIKWRVQQQIDIAKRVGDNLKEGVEEWLNKADVEISKAHEFLEQEANAKKTCFKIGICGNWATLHRYGKMATKMTPSLLKIQQRGRTYETCVSVYTPAPGPLDAYRHKDLDGIDTHNSALKAIIAALEDESQQIIGIHGLGGVGKTTLAMEVTVRVKTNPSFADVAFINVSGTVDVDKIKKDTREATKRILKGEKVLIILDDVREKFDLEELCIPCGSNYKNCKILLTSRSEKVCQKMNAQIKICVNSLPEKEAWILFKRVIGERVETDADLKAVAEEVAKECGGLPLLIQVVGNALKNESIDSWNLALSRLKKQAPLDKDPDILKAFTHLKLSYDYLENEEEAKSCFLLCSLFPDDEIITLEDLVYYMVGLQKFDELDSIEDARGRVQNAVNILTSSALLLKVEDDEEVTKMHDVVRDVALLIASEGENKFLVKSGLGLTEWQPRDNSSSGYTGISLMKNRISKLPDKVHLPSVDTFLVHQNELSSVSDEFFQGMREVKVLDMSGNNISYLPQSLGLLTKLRMLNLSGNKAIHDISILGELKNLEILKLKSTGIRKIPEEIGQLINLRLLDVDSCENLSYVTPGVISKLIRLEELHIRFFGQKGVNGCLVEISTLRRLQNLSLSLPSCDLVPDGFNFETLREFRIQIVGSGSWDQVESRIKRQLRIIGCSLPFTQPIMKLIHVSDVIELSFIKGLDNIVPYLYEAGLGQLKSIKLQDCSDVTSLVKACHLDAIQVEEIVLECLPNLKLILWNSLHQYPSFCMLGTIRIIGCHSLSMLFPLSVAQGLDNLRYVSISECNNLEVVISDGVQQTDGSEIEEIGRSGCEQTCSSETDLGILVFPSLTSIRLYGLPKLNLFSSGHSTIKYPSLKLVQVEDCPSMERWGYGSHETPNLHHLETQFNIIGISAVHKKDDVTRIRSKIRMDSFTKGNRMKFWKNELVQGE